MEITFTGKQVDTGDALRSHVLTTLEEHISKYFTAEEASGHVVLSQQRGFFQVNIQVHINKRVMVSSRGEHGDAYGAYAEALEHITKRLRRHKRRLKSHRGEKDNKEKQATVTGRHYVLDIESIAEEENTQVTAQNHPLVIAENHSETQTMSVREAVAQLDIEALPFLLFREIKSQNINLVYPRSDGHIGWIDP